MSVCLFISFCLFVWFSLVWFGLVWFCLCLFCSFVVLPSLRPASPREGAGCCETLRQGSGSTNALAPRRTTNVGTVVHLFVCLFACLLARFARHS